MRLISVLVLLSLAACERSPTAPARSLLVTAVVSPPTFRVGEATRVQITVTNRGTQTETVNPYHGYCGLAYDVLRADGTDTDLGQQIICSASLLSPQPLEPGASYTVTQWWSTQDLPVPAGRYTVRAALQGSNVQSVAASVQITP